MGLADAHARATLADVLFQVGKPTDAVTVAKQAEVLLRALGSELAATELLSTMAQLRAASGDAAMAWRELRADIAHSEKVGLLNSAA